MLPQKTQLESQQHVLNKMPGSVQPKAKGELHEFWQAETREDASKAFDAFVEKVGAKYSGACKCLTKAATSC